MPDDARGPTAAHPQARGPQQPSAAPPHQGWYPLSTGAFFSPPGVSAPAGPSAPASPGPPSSEIRVGENGYIHGVDGMLDQIARALTRHAGPMLVRDVLPSVQRDEAMHARVGQAMGAAIAERWRPWLILGAGALGVLATVEVIRFLRATPRGSALRPAPRRTRRT